MKRTPLAVLCLLLAPPLFADANTHIIPAGSLVSCTTGDGRISSKSTALGDPVLCKVEHRRGDFMLPYGSYLGGEFAEYKNPGHFVGKGWMELSFDKLYVGDTVVPIDAKVVDVPGYKIDAQGRILGKGHEARDITLWCIPVLWPIDLLMLPMRGPRPTLKPETVMTLRLMDDVEVPTTPEPQRDPYGLYQRSPNAYAPEPPAPTQAPYAGPQNAYLPQPMAPMYVAPVAYVPLMPYVVPIFPTVVVAPPVVAYGGVVFGTQPAVYPYYAPGAYAGGGVSPYGYAAPSAVPVRPTYGYGYMGPGSGSGGPMTATRSEMTYGVRMQ
jgi:hypothetical protein